LRKHVDHPEFESLPIPSVVIAGLVPAISLR
jgi:hypothetical protein